MLFQVGVAKSARAGMDVVIPPEKKAKMEGSVDKVCEGILFGMGNPLLDISAVVPASFRDKYELKDNDAILAQPKHLPIYQAMVDTFKVEYIAGGATQNSIRVAQWMLQHKNATSYLGCVGKDHFALQLKEKAEEAGVRVSYLEDDEHSTGTCACLIVDTVRSLVANLGAANHYKLEHLKQVDNWALVEKCKFVYISGFFLTVSQESIMEVAKHCAETNKHFMMNLAAPFICLAFKEKLLEAIPYIDILFGNETEALAFSQAMEYGLTDLKEIARKAGLLPKVNKSRPRVVIFTHGPDPVLVCQNGTVSEHSIWPLAKGETVLDTNGAGDAWVGGFLSQLVLGQRVEQCVDGGNYAAHVVILRSGCTYPDKPTFSPSSC